jgi:ribosomal protein S18 acetylase RimI-like enzyme
VNVRIASSADAEAIERTRIRGWQTAYRHVFPPEELDRLEVDWSRWTARLESPTSDSTTFVAERDKRILGFASVGPSRDEPDTGELYAIYVEPSAWSSGVGRALIERAEKRLAEEYDQATLWVLEDNPRARAFYERAGWHVEAQKLAEHLGKLVPSVRYRKQLTGPRAGL